MLSISIAKPTLLDATLLCTILYTFKPNSPKFVLQIDQSLFAVCPSRPDMRPGMVLVFEMLMLRGPVTPIDKVVGWGCFPICDGNFNIADGR